MKFFHPTYVRGTRSYINVRGTRSCLLVTLSALLAVGAAAAADRPFRISVTVDPGLDRGQNRGSLFEITDARGRVVAGAGFQGAVNTRIRHERELLQFFIRTSDRPAQWDIERLPPIETEETGFYPFTLAGKLHVFNDRGSASRVYRWDTRGHAWETVDGVRPTTHTVAGKQLQHRGEQLLYDGVVLVDAKQDRQRIGEFYYAQGNLFVRQFGGAGDARTNRVVVYPWTPETRATGLLPAQEALTHQLSIPYEFFYSFGQWQDHMLGITNVGTILRFSGQQWQVLREPDLHVSYQVYSAINFHDRLLLGQYPHGGMFEYDGEAARPLDDWPPVMPGVAKSARELQSAAIYGGDLYVGVWPWAEVWRYDADPSQWNFVQRMFNHPELTDQLQHPYESETKKVDDVANLWGQRVTGLVPLANSLIITTSSKGGQQWEPRFAFLTPEQRSDYSAIYRATLPGNLATWTQWKPGPTTFAFTLADGRLTIAQDGRELGSLDIDADLRKEFRPARIRWGEGVFGKCTGKIVSHKSTLASVPLPKPMRAAYLHPHRIFKKSADPAACRAASKQLLQQADSIELNTLFPYFLGSSGQAYYPSDFASRGPFGGHDPLGELVKEAKSRGTKVYPVVCVATCGGEKPAGVLLEHPEWGLRHPDGSPLGYLSPAHPDARRWIVRVIDEIIERYDPDGVMLDYIRFHNRPLRLDVAGEERFESTLPAGCSPEERQQRYQAFKEAELTTWVREIAQAVRQKKASAAVGAYCWGPNTVKNHLTAQVWPKWVEQGDLDFVSISGYLYREANGDQFMSLFEKRMAEAVAINQALPQPAPLSFTLGIKTSHGRVHSADEIRAYLSSGETVGVQGVAYFTWHDLVEYLPELAGQ